MKTLYIAVIWLIMFQGAALMIASLGVFPAGTTLYSDFDMQELQDNADDPAAMLAYFFTGDVSEWAGFSIDSVTLMSIIGVIAIGGAAISVFSGNYVAAVLAILGLTFIPMVTHSLGFFRKLFMYWDVSAMAYMGVLLALGVLLLFLIHIIETPTQGDS